MIDPVSQLNNGVALAEIGGHSTGPWCAKHGAGAALVVLSTFIVGGRDAPFILLNSQEAVATGRRFPVDQRM